MKFENKEIKIADLISSIKSTKKARGSITIPEFQRNYVWNDDKKITNLIESIYFGFPIGSLLYWKQGTNDYILDGLQRTFSIVLFSNNPFKYLNENMLIKFLEDNNFSFELNKDGKLFNTLKSKIKNSDKTKSENFNYEDILVNLEKMRESNKMKKPLISFVEHFNNWVTLNNNDEKEFLNYLISSIELTAEVSFSEATKIFNTINTQGIKLTKLETSASLWSEYSIDVSNIDFIKKFIIDRRNRYNEKIGISSDNLISNLNPKTANPIDVIFSIFWNSVIDTNFVKSLFCNFGPNGFESIINKTSESILAIFMTYFNIKSFNKKTIDDFGKTLKDKFKTDADIISCKNNLKEVFDFIEDSLEFLHDLNSNSKNGKNIDISTALISAIAMTILKIKNSTKTSEDKENALSKFKEEIPLWIINETLFETYSTSSTNVAWQKVANLEYINNEIDKDVLNQKIKKYIDDEFNSQSKTKVITDKLKLIISIFEFNFYKFTPRTSNGNYEIDHFIPKSLIKQNEVNGNLLNSFYNLQFLKARINKSKSNFINWENEEWDLLKKNAYINQENIVKYNELLKSISNDLCNLVEKSKNGNTYEICELPENYSYSTFEELIKLRKAIMDEIIKEGIIIK